MDQGAIAELIFTAAFILTWAIDKVKTAEHNRIERIELAELLSKIDKHFDDKVDELKEDIEELEDIVEGRE